jgi:hypothetical protein
MREGTPNAKNKSNKSENNNNSGGGKSLSKTPPAVGFDVFFFSLSFPVLLLPLWLSSEGEGEHRCS